MASHAFASQARDQGPLRSLRSPGRSTVLLMLSFLIAFTSSVFAQAVGGGTSEEDQVLIDTFAVQRFVERNLIEANADAEIIRIARQRDKALRERARAVAGEASVRSALRISKGREQAANAEIENLRASALAKDVVYRRLLSEQLALIASITKHNQQLQAEYDSYRQFITKAVEEASPRKRDLLRRYTLEERAQTYGLLVELDALEKAAEDRAVERVIADVRTSAAQKSDTRSRLRGSLGARSAGH